MFQHCFGTSKKCLQGGSLSSKDLAVLFRVLQPRLVGYFLRCTDGEATAHELAQETFIRALINLDSFRGDSKLSTWVWSIAANVLREHYRNKRAASFTGAEEPVDPDTLISEPPLHLNVQIDCVRRGFARFAALHPERAQVLYLAYVEGWTRDELAEHLGRTPHATTEYLSQCKQKLRPFIQDCDGC